MQKIILYYKFVLVKDPAMVLRWQRELCTRLQLKGRIIISDHGINGTLGGETAKVEEYIKAMNLVPEFDNIEYKWTDGSADDFPKLSIKNRKELVTLEANEDFDIFDRGTPLRPEQWHAYLEEYPNAIIFDARNGYESQVGKFKNATAPDIKAFKDIKRELEKLPKDQPILTYCTGDIRCEYLTAYMKHKGFQTVYHLDGGIIKYGQQFGDDGFWEGKCYVFDKRMSLAFSASSKDIGTCANCKAETGHQENCADPACDVQFVICDTCAQGSRVICSRHTGMPANRFL